MTRSAFVWSQALCCAPLSLLLPLRRKVEQEMKNFNGKSTMFFIMISEVDQSGFENEEIQSWIRSKDSWGLAIRPPSPFLISRWPVGQLTVPQWGPTWAPFSKATPALGSTRLPSPSLACPRFRHSRQTLLAFICRLLTVKAWLKASKRIGSQCRDNW